MKIKAKKQSPLEKAVSMFNSKAEMARALNVEPPYINKMLRENHVPWQQCKAIEKVTGGAVTAAELNPKVFGAEEITKKKVRRIPK